MSEPLVEIVRGEVVEAVHRGDVALVSADGELRGAIGDPGTIIYWRSAAKPFQALPVVTTGAAEHFGFGAEDLALCAASHNGEPVHVERVASMLARIGRDVEDLICGVHPPLDPLAAAELERRDVRPIALHNNCSGKHTGMLAVAGQLGTDAAGYESEEHPAQRAILNTVARFAGLEEEEIVLAEDGCGVPCFGTSLYQLALAFARLLNPPPDLEPALADAARAVTGAMAAHPYLVAGRERFDTALMEAGAGALVAKGGASGVQCVGVRGGLGLALKIEDGAGAAPPFRPGAVAAIEALRQFDLLADGAVSELDAYARPPVKTVAGKRVGEARPVFETRRVGEAAGLGA